MFCSNQKFSVCGNKRDTKALEKSLDLIINGFDVPFRYYSIGEDGFLYFYKYKPNNDFSEIEKEDLTLNYYLSLINLYFNSFKYKDTLKNRVFNEYSGADGSSSEGWEIVLDNKTFETKLVIKPYWCFYHK